MEELAKAQPADLVGRTVFLGMATSWVERAKTIQSEREKRIPIREAEPSGSEAFDELVSKFRLDPAAFEGAHAA